MISRARAVCSAIALTLLTPVVGAAQPSSPFADLFGRAPARSGREYTAVQFRATTGAQFAQTLRSDFDQADVVPEGAAGGADASLLAEYIRDRVQVIGNGRYSYQEYRNTPAFGAPAFEGGGRINLKATTRLSFEAGGQFYRSPYFQLMSLGPAGDVQPLAPLDAAILLLENDNFEVNGGVTTQLSKRSSLSFSGFQRETRFSAVADQHFEVRGARGMWKHQVSRSLGVHAGYGHEELRQTLGGAEERSVNELIDVGVDFTKSLSMARRTTLGFGTETSLVGENGASRRFRLNAMAVLDHRFMRTWVAQVSAKRGTEFLPGFRGPVFTERGSVALAGYLAKRVLLNVNGEGTQGAVGVNNQRQFVTYTGSAKLTVGVTRHVGFFTQYAYYDYQMPPDLLALMTVPRLSRQAVSIGVQTWISILDKDKVTRDPR